MSSRSAIKAGLSLLTSSHGIPARAFLYLNTPLLRCCPATLLQPACVLMLLLLGLG